MASILRRFQLGGKKEREVVRLFDDHMGMVLKAVEGLRELVSSASKDDWSLTVARAELIAKYETLADDVHREAVVELSRGAFFAGMREDFLNLLERVDSIADAAQNAAHILAQAEPNRKASIEILSGEHPNLTDLVEKSIEAVMLARESVSALQSDTNLAVEKAMNVEKAEELADRLKDLIVRKIYTMRDKADPLTILQLRDFTLKIDDVADTAEDVSDLVIMIVAKASG